MVGRNTFFIIVISICGFKIFRAVEIFRVDGVYKAIRVFRVV